MIKYAGKARPKTKNGSAKHYAEAHKAIMACVRENLAYGDDAIAELTGYHPVTVRKHRMAEFGGELTLNRDVKQFITDRDLYDEFMAWRESKKKPDVPRFTSANLTFNPELHRDL